MAIVEDILYRLGLSDMLTSKLEGANVAAKGLEATMGGVEAILGSLGIAMGVFAGAEFLKGSVEAFNESEQASAQLTASLLSTANAANLNREALDAQAAALMKITLFDDDAVTSSQALLATFTNVKDSIYMEAIPAITDLAAKMGGDLQGATIQVGKALNDPITGIAALHRVGVSFSEAQKKVIESLVNTGHAAEAQKLILQELNTEFGGSAAAAALAGTGSFTILQHQFQNVREEIGGMVVALGTSLLPVFEGIVTGVGNIVSGIKSMAHWVKENTDVFKGLGAALVVVGAGVVALNAGLIIEEGLWAAGYIAVQSMTGAVWLLNAATTFFAGVSGLGLLVAGLAVVAGAVVYCYNHFDKFRETIKGVWAYVKSFAVSVGEIFLAVGKIVVDALIRPWRLGQDFSELANAAGNAGTSAAKAYTKAYNEAVEEDYKGAGPKKANNSPLVLMSARNKGKDSGAPEATKASALTPSKATGTKAVNVTINIGKLIEKFEIKTTNIMDSAGKIEQAVANALLRAANDASLYVDL